MDGVAVAEVFVSHDQPEHVALGQAKPAATNLRILIDRQGGRGVGVARAGCERSMPLTDDVIVQASDALKFRGILDCIDKPLSQPL